MFKYGALLISKEEGKFGWYIGKVAVAGGLSLDEGTTASMGSTYKIAQTLGSSIMHRGFNCMIHDFIVKESIICNHD